MEHASSCGRAPGRAGGGLAGGKTDGGAGGPLAMEISDSIDGPRTLVERRKTVPTELVVVVVLTELVEVAMVECREGC